MDKTGSITSRTTHTLKLSKKALLEMVRFQFEHTKNLPASDENSIFISTSKESDGVVISWSDGEENYHDLPLNK